MRLSLPTPKEIVEHLDRFVRGQSEAKRALAKAVYYHYLKLADPGPSSGPSAPEHCLIVGPTGSGKTLLVKTLASYLGVPVFFVDASSLTSEGYVGESVGDMLARLAKFCDEDPFKLERAIVYLDEIDKCAKTSGGDRDIRGEMVQHELLTVLDGNSLSRIKDATKTLSYSLDTSKLLLVASGAFSGIEKIVAKRSGKEGIGFSSTGKAAGDAEKQTIPVEGGDIIEFGFIPELVGRFANVVQLNPLTVDDLTEILKSKEQSPLTRNQSLFDLHGVSLTFTHDAMRSLAEKVLDQKKGARGLRQAVNDALRDLEWRLPELASEGVRAIEIDESCVMGRGEAKLHADGNARNDEELRARRDRIFNREYFEQQRSGEGKIAEPSVQAEGLRMQGEENGEMQRAVPTTVEAELLRHAKKKLGYSDSWRGRDAWEKFEKANGDDPSKPLEVANSLLDMGATLDDLYAAMKNSNVQTTGALLRYIAFTKARQNAEALPSPVLKGASGYAEHMAQRSARNIVGFDECTGAARVVWLCVEYQLQGDRLLKFADELVGAGVRSAEQLLDLQAMAACPFAEPTIQYVPFWSKKLQEMLADGILTPEIKKVYEPGTRPRQLRGNDPLERHYRLRNAARRRSIERLIGTFPRFATEHLFTSLDDLSEIRRWGRPYATAPEASEVDRDPRQSFPEAAQQWIDTLRAYPGELCPDQRDAFLDIVSSDLNRALLADIRSGIDVDVAAWATAIVLATKSAGTSADLVKKAFFRWLPPASEFSSDERSRLYEILEAGCDGTTRSEWEASPYLVAKNGRVSRLARRRGEMPAETAPSLEPSIAEWWTEASRAPIASSYLSRKLEDEMRASGIGMAELHGAHLATGSGDLWACFEYARYSRCAASGSGSRRTVATMRTSKEGLEPAHLSARERLHFEAASPAACAFWSFIELSGQYLGEGSTILSGELDIERIFEIAALARTANLEAILHYERFVSLLEELRWEEPDSRSVSTAAWKKRERLVELARSSLLHTVLGELQSSASERTRLGMRHTRAPEFPFATLEEELEGWEAAAGIYPGEIFPELLEAVSEEIVSGLEETFLADRNVSLVSAARRLCVAFRRAVSERDVAADLAKRTIDSFDGRSVPASVTGCVAELEKAFGPLCQRKKSQWWRPRARAGASA